MLPTVDACIRLMETTGMLTNIMAHSVVVARIAHLISRRLAEAGKGVSVETATAGALLHDIGKTRSLRTGEDHSKLGSRICLEHGFGEIASIVAEHVRLTGYCLDGDYSEKEIVYYADKRVNHDEVVSLDERLDYLLERYGGTEKHLRRAIRSNFEMCRSVEEKLFRALDFAPEALSVLVIDEDIGAVPCPGASAGGFGR